MAAGVAGGASLASAGGTVAGSASPKSRVCISRSCKSVADQDPNTPSYLRGLVADGWTLSATGESLLAGHGYGPPQCSGSSADGEVAMYLIAYKGPQLGPEPFSCSVHMARP